MAYHKQKPRTTYIARDEVDRTINGRRMQHLTALDLEKLARFGLHAGIK